MRIQEITKAVFNTQAQKEIPSQKKNDAKQGNQSNDYTITFSTQEERDLNKEIKNYKDIAKIGLCQRLKDIVENNEKLNTEVFQQQRQQHRY